MGFLSLSLPLVGVLIVPPPGLPPGVARGCLLEGNRHSVGIPAASPLDRPLEGAHRAAHRVCPWLGADISPIFHTCLCTSPAPGRASTA
jgi:hypothetical protein